MPSSMVTPKVLLVDDQPSALQDLANAIANEECSSAVLRPDEVTEADLKSADLVLVDLTLDDWLSNIPKAPISCRPPNGIALAAVFRQYSDSLKSVPPTAYALITGQANFFDLLPTERRPHIISRLSHFEWFFEKQNSFRNTKPVIELARAVRSLPRNVTKDLASADALLHFLGITADNRLSDRYQADVMRCRPPLHHLSERSHGLIIIRWLLHRILPHTCFLLDRLNLAARLRVTPHSLDTGIVQNEKLASELAPLKYSGPLSAFDGDRWWRGGVEQWLWEKTNGESADSEAVHKYLQSLGPPDLEVSSFSLPVVTVDKDLRPTATFAEFSDAMPLRLDDWPDYAEPAYVTEETLAEQPEMRAYVSNLP